MRFLSVYFDFIGHDNNVLKVNLTDVTGQPLFDKLRLFKQWKFSIRI